jgi:hypothetical protein
MWAELVKNLKAYPSAVLSGLDVGGYPFSVRCIPQPDPSKEVLLVQIPPQAAIQPGWAGLLCHSHDEQIWSLKSFGVHGTLEQQGNGWVFKPRRLIAGMGSGGLPGTVKQIVGPRRTAQQYLERRSLPRPKVDWDGMKALWAEAKQSERPEPQASHQAPDDTPG